MLDKCVNVRELRHALDTLPKGVESIYALTMERVEQHPQGVLAKRALTWLVYALESLTMDMLRHALAVDTTHYTYDPELLVDADTLISVCCGLITFEPKSELVRLVRECTFSSASVHLC